jgi:hypothetical protein
MSPSRLNLTLAGNELRYQAVVRERKAAIARIGGPNALACVFPSCIRHRATIELNIGFRTGSPRHIALRTRSGICSPPRFRARSRCIELVRKSGVPFRPCVSSDAQLSGTMGDGGGYYGIPKGYLCNDDAV